MIIVKSKQHSLLNNFLPTHPRMKTMRTKNTVLILHNYMQQEPLYRYQMLTRMDWSTQRLQ